MSATKRIALLVPQDIGYGRALLRGIQQYAVTKPDWVFRDAPPTVDSLKPLRDWKPHGIIALLFDAAVAKSLTRMRRPLVNTTSTLPLANVPLVENDHEAIGRLAAEYFLKRGFRNFGYFGSSWMGSSLAREAGFREVVERAGFRVAICYGEYLPRPETSASWVQADRRTDKWLESLPTPVAIFAQNDVPARDLAHRCRELGLNIPHEVAMMGVDNDHLECHLCHPPLTSIATPGRRIGVEAARMLDQLLQGITPDPLQQFFAPVGVVARQSTETLAVEDETIARVIRLIHERATAGLTVADIERQVNISRRQIERRFRQQFGATLLTEIRRVRVDRAKQLLAETDLDMLQIAAETGFNEARRMSMVFKEQTGMTPSDFRRSVRIGAEGGMNDD